MGHWFKGFIVVIDRGLCIYFSDVQERINGGPYCIGGDSSILQILYPFWHDEIPIFVRDVCIQGVILIVCLKAIGAIVEVVQCLEFFQYLVFELVDAGGCLVSFHEAIHVSFSEGRDKSMDNGAEHVCGKLCIVSNGGLDGLRGEGCGRRLSHNGCELFGGDGERWHCRSGGAFLWRFEGHGGHGHVLAMAGVVMVWAVMVAAEVPVLDGVVMVSFDG